MIWTNRFTGGTNGTDLKLNSPLVLAFENFVCPFKYWQA